MENMRALRARVKSLESTRQITSSMKMVAASKLRRTQNAYSRLMTFAEKSREILEEVAGCAEGEAHPLLRSGRARNTVCYVLFLGNRGLCGSYHQSLLHYFRELAEGETAQTVLVTCGRWRSDALQKTGVPLLRTFSDISDTPTPAQAQELTEYLKELYLSGQADEVVLVYQQYKSVLVQSPGSRCLLPAVPCQGQEEGREYLFEPDKRQLLNLLVDQYLQNTVCAVMLETKTCEHSARMSAMTAASDNTDALMEQLQLKMNHARQAAITTEISEISGGASVLDRDRR